MVTKKEISEFKQTLTSALQKAGYTAFGRISSSEDIYNFYAQLPEEEMVSLYVEDNNLEIINRVYRVIQYISENSGNFYSLKNLCKEHGVDYKLFAHAVENLPYIDKTGDRRKTQYNWIHDQHPSYSTAKEMVEHMRELRITKLSKGLKTKIQRAVAKGISKDEFFKNNKIKKEATYNADAYWNYQKVQQQPKDVAIPEALPESELSPVLTETELQDPGNVLVSVEEKNQSLAASEVIDETGLQMENYILRKEIKYFKKINKAKDKLIKALRKHK